MSLGTRISELRKQSNYSQEYIAEKLEVSRQAVSKWEQNQSNPDTDNLIKLAELFNVSVEYLATGKTEPPTLLTTPQKQAYGAQRIIGFILLAVGLISGVLAFIFSMRSLAIIVLYLLLCGILCLIIKKHVGILIGWITFLPIAISLPYFIRSSMGAIFYRSYYQNGNYFGLLISFIMWLLLLGLLWFTIKITAFRKKEK